MEEVGERPAETRIGVLADTHGLLRPEVLERLDGCHHILHAGDVGSDEILPRLEALAPTVAVRGNVDLEGKIATLPAVQQGEISGLEYRMVHRREDVDPAWTHSAGLVVFGHSHRPEIDWRGRCLLLNPGSCGRRRFHLPLTLAILTVRAGRILPELHSLET